MAKPELVFIGIRGSVIAMDRKSGARIWETKLKGGTFVSLLVDGDLIFAGAYGEIFCLEAATGNVLWHDGLRGYGLGLMSIATQNGSTDLKALAAEEDRRSQQSADAGTAGGG